MKDHGFPHYIDFWLFDDKYEGDKIKCAGRLVEDDSPVLGYIGDDDMNHESTSQQYTRGCDKWYWNYNAKPPPTFEWNKHFPPVYQVRRHIKNCNHILH